MKNEFVLAFNEVLEEKQLPKQIVLEALEAAMVSAYRRAVNASNAQHVEAKIDPETGRPLIYAEKEIVENVVDERTEVSLQEARKVDPKAEMGGMVIVESTPKDFGRVAAQTARQVIQQRIREAERDSQLDHFGKQIGEIVSGVVQAIGPQGVALGLEMKAEGIMPRNQQIPGERYRVHDRIRALLLEVKQTPRGPQIILSRAHRNFLRRLLENEVPEIYHGLVEIRSISREPGQRSKVAVAALQPAVDPVGACVGIRGVRIQAIVRELNDEKIDVIEWNSEPAVYIAKALSPARVTGVYLNEHTKGAKTATVVVPEDQLSLAIGRDGQNARLAAKLTSWRIDIKSLPEAASDALNKLQTDPEYAFLVENETDVIPQVEGILAKKAEGRPVTPEEYTVISQFVDRVERGILRQRQAEKLVADEREQAIRAKIPEPAFTMLLEDLPLTDKVINLLVDAGYQTVGNLMFQFELDPDSILGLSGVGSKVMRDIEAALSSVVFPEPIKEIKPEEEAAVSQPEYVEATEGLPTTIEAVSELAEVALTPTPEIAEITEGEKVPVEALEVAPSAEAQVETIPEVAEGIPQEVSEPEPVGDIEKPIEAELPTSFDEIFTLRPDVIDMVTSLPDEDEDEESEAKQGKKGKKKKRKYVEVEYDPEKDMVIAKKKRKRGSSEWEDNWSI